MIDFLKEEEERNRKLLLAAQEKAKGLLQTGNNILETVTLMADGPVADSLFFNRKSGDSGWLVHYDPYLADEKIIDFLIKQAYSIFITEVKSSPFYGDIFQEAQMIEMEKINEGWANRPKKELKGQGRGL